MRGLACQAETASALPPFGVRGPAAEGEGLGLPGAAVGKADKHGRDNQWIGRFLLFAVGRGDVLSQPDVYFDAVVERLIGPL